MNQIQPYHEYDPELWDNERNMVRRAFNDAPVRIKRDDAIRILMPMFALFPQAKMSEIAIEQYLRLLQDISPGRLQKAVDGALSCGEWLPTVAAIRKQYDLDRRRAESVVDVNWQEELSRNVEWIVCAPDETKEARMAQLQRYRRKGDQV